MIGASHQKAIKNWLDLFGASRRNAPQTVEGYRFEYSTMLIKYSQKKGLIPRLEAAFKRKFGCNYYPKILKGKV